MEQGPTRVLLAWGRNWPASLMLASLSPPVHLPLRILHAGREYTLKTNTKEPNACFVGGELWSLLMLPTSKPFPGMSSFGWTTASRCRNLTANSTAWLSCSGWLCVGLVWKTEDPRPCWAAAPAPILWEQAEVKSCWGAKVRGSRAVTTLWSAPIGLLEISQLWLCSVLWGNGCLQAVPGWETLILWISQTLNLSWPSFQLFRVIMGILRDDLNCVNPWTKNRNHPFNGANPKPNPDVNFL